MSPCPCNGKSKVKLHLIHLKIKSVKGYWTLNIFLSALMNKAIYKTFIQCWHQGISTHLSKQVKISRRSVPNYAHVMREELTSIDSFKAISYIRNHLALSIPELQTRRKCMASS